MVSSSPEVRSGFSRSFQTRLKRSAARRRRSPSVRIWTPALLLGRFADRPVLDLVDDGWVGQRGRVPERSVLSDVPQETAHDLSAPGLWQLRREDDVRGLG